MITDAQLAFIPSGAPLSCVGAAGVNFQSGVIDLLGAGVGMPPPGIIGNVSVFGEDPGIGSKRPQLAINVGAAFGAGAGTPTLNFQMQYAPDTGAGGNYQPGAWQTVVESGALTVAQLTAGQTIARFDMPPAFPAGARPRFMRLNFAVPAATDFSAGTSANALVTNARDDLANRWGAKNFNV